MRAIMVSVNYADLLEITLPYNLHHFDEVWIVTDGRSVGGVLKAMEHVPSELSLRVHVCMTELFYANGAQFNKWAALEWGLDQMGREGWLCVMDADVLWPKSLISERIGDCWGLNVPGSKEVFMVQPGQLCTPMRRMWDEWPNAALGAPLPLGQGLLTAVGRVPSEELWSLFPLHRQQHEFAGYSQIFHASDPVLGPPPWHQVDWKHAGGADSFFQAKWPAERKVRPPFEVLHLGPAGANWFGRATPLADGTVLPGSAERRLSSSASIWQQRRRNRAEGRDQFHGERLG